MTSSFAFACGMMSSVTLLRKISQSKSFMELYLVLLITLISMLDCGLISINAINTGSVRTGFLIIILSAVIGGSLAYWLITKLFHVNSFQYSIGKGELNWRKA